MSMVDPKPTSPSSTAFRWALVLAFLLLGGITLIAAMKIGRTPAVAAEAQAEEPKKEPEKAADPKKDPPPDPDRIPAPELEGGVAWLNTAGPLRLRDLRGKIVLLDFWTLCCINCIHTLPDLAKLEKKYGKELVVIGVHSAKFENEKDSESIRKAVLRYEISHPVVNDADMKIWRSYAVRSWPTLALIDPEGYYLGQASGEGNYELLDKVIGKVIEVHKARKTLNEEPLRFDLARFKERGDSPLFFPGKVLADATGKRLFIADSTHHRIVVTDLDGKKIAVIGAGEPGRADGGYAKAQFNDPQGMVLRGDSQLYVADRKNHLLRLVDLKAQTVKTVAGTGEQGINRQEGGSPLKTGLNSPWDLYLVGSRLFIAMAGHHQIWALDLDKDDLQPYAGAGPENIRDGTLASSLFAQPSGLTGDGTNLYVADSEVSAIRAVSLDPKGRVKTIVGEGLFEFGDQDGTGDDVRLQHALGVAWHDGKLYVADTYNSKLKIIDPAKRACKTWLGGDAGWLAEPLFNEPAGISFAGDKLYVADTNAHRIRVVDLKTNKVSTLALQGVEPPKPVAEADGPSFPNARRAKLPPTTVARDSDLTLQIDLKLARGFKLNSEAKMTYLLEPLGKAGWSEKKALAEVKNPFTLVVPAARLTDVDLEGLRLSLVYFECNEGSEGVCRIKSQIWEIPLKFDAKAKERVIQLAGSSGEKAEK
jgi:thiol-disulfide isomerase/thioredoxin